MNGWVLGRWGAYNAVRRMISKPVILLYPDVQTVKKNKNGLIKLYKNNLE